MTFCPSLNKKSALEVVEAKDGNTVKPGKVFIAPGGRQMKIVAGADGLNRKIKITDDPPENSCKPSADYLFRSIAQHYIGRATGVIMTGMGSDGSKGLVQMKKSKHGFNKKLEDEIVDAISTNETYFFRDKSPFKLLQHKILPDLIDKRSKKSFGKPTIRIWSAANSTGQELYSLAITMIEMGVTLDKYNIRLVGTDISDADITKASYGVYNKFEVARGLDPARLNRFFHPMEDKYKVKDELRAMVQSKKMNLIKPFIGIGKFDIVLCRNVMI